MRYLTILAAIAIAVLACSIGMGVDFWPTLFWYSVGFAALDFAFWAAPKIWRWLTRSSPGAIDDWQRMMATDAAPLQLHPDLMAPGNVIMARDLGLPDDATFGEMNAEMRRRWPAPKPAGRYAVRGPDGKFVKRPA
jgi:hypothetical protein